MSQSSKTSEFKQDPRNANKGTERGRQIVKDSLQRLKAGRSILVDKHGVAIAGNKTLQAAIDAGLQDAIVVETDGSQLVVVKRTDLDLETDAAAKELAIVDNRASELGLEWDAEIIAELNQEIDLSGLWNPGEFQALIGDLGGEGGSGKKGGEDQEQDPDFENELVEVAEGRIPSRVKVGEVWEVADQRLLCGDCRMAESFAGLLMGRSINLCVTSPPYAQQRSYDKSSGFDPIPADEYASWYAPIAANIKNNLALSGSYFLNIKEHSEDFQRHLYVKDLIVAHVRAWGWSWLDEFVWTHSGIPGSPQKMGKFKNQWEPIFWFALTNRPKFHPDRVVHGSSEAIIDDNYQPGLERSQGRKPLMGDRQQGEGKAYPGNVLSLGKNDEKCGHSAAFPIALPEFFIQAYTDASDIVFDPFLGSGTTLIAAHQNSRAGLGVELSPAYCEVILRRLERLTGGAANRVNF